VLAVDESPLLSGERGLPELRLKDPHGREHALTLGARTHATIGRASDCDVILNDPRVSRRHATLELVEDHHLLRDEGSSNGTFLNGLRLTPGNAFSLREGDVVDMGECRLFYGRVAAPPADEKTERFELVELTAQGYARLDPLGRRELQAEVQLAFDAAPRVVGIERALRVLVARSA
jgi:predicted component of type VI protein secretion system